MARSAEADYSRDNPDLGVARLRKIKKQLKIDRMDLDEEVSQQPFIYFDVSELASIAISVRDKAKGNIEEVDATVSRRIRARLAKRGSGEKVTEGMVKDRLYSDEEHMYAVDYYLVAKERAEKWNSLKAAFEQRASMLKYQVQLFLNNYYSSSSVKGSRDYESDKATLREHRKTVLKRRG